MGSTNSGILRKLDDRGILGVLEFSKIPFTPQRVYWISDVPSGVTRGGHAHRKLEQLFVIAKGSVTINLDDGVKTSEFTLTNESEPLQVHAGTWRELIHFSRDAVLIVIASLAYDEKDYIRDYVDFLKWKNE